MAEARREMVPVTVEEERIVLVLTLTEASAIRALLETRAATAHSIGVAQALREAGA